MAKIKVIKSGKESAKPVNYCPWVIDNDPEEFIVRVPKLELEVVADGSGDLLDAVICATQAAWGWARRKSNYGLPADAPAGEGWILTA